MNKILLIILDGVGSAPKSPGNAVALANLKTLPQLWNTHPHTYLLASAQAVGLPKGIKGNSEVGHLNIGAGRVINQNLPRIDRYIEKGHIDTNNVLFESLRHSIQNGGNVHLLGCLSDGAVHSHINHLLAVLKFFAQNNFTGNVIIHAFTDGRDSSPNEAGKYFEIVEKQIAKLGVGSFGTIVGRYLAMDRNQTWDRTQQAYDLLTKLQGTKYGSWKEALDSAYSQGKTDEFIPPSVVSNGDVRIKEGDSVVFLNFRSDRALQLSEAFLLESFNHFPTIKFSNLYFSSMVEYRKNFPKNILFPKEYINLPLGKIIAEAGHRQLRIAESEKYPHVTYFFNGGSSIRFQNEDRIEIPSPSVATYDLKPEMSTKEVVDSLVGRIRQNIYDFILLNLANGDMVGHTGNLEASIKAVETMDWAVETLVRQFTALGGTVIITSDHGNVEEVLDLKTGQIDTEHSINPVPLIIVGPNTTIRGLPYGSLKDIAPTVLNLMKIPIPSEMTGRSLLPLV